MALDTAEAFPRLAKNAAARWKITGNQCPALKDQIIDCFRLTKELQRSTGFPTIGPLIKTWEDAFRNAGCLNDFDFRDTSEL